MKYEGFPQKRKGGGMRFGDSVELFSLAGIPMVGNMDSGAVAGLTPEGAALCERLAREDVAEEEARAVDENLVNFLLAGRFFEDAADRAAVPVSAYLHVTQRCNLDCKGCYSLDDDRNSLADAPFEAMARAIDELAGAGVRTLIVSGGEPFLRADLPQLVQRAKEAGITAVTVITNGTCATDEMLAALAPWAGTVAVSVDGWSSDCRAHIRSEQRYDQLADTVRRIQSAGMKAHIVPTIHALNYGDLPRYVEMGEALGATMNYSLLSCEACDALAHLLPGDNELRDLARGLLALGASPRQSTSGPFGVNLDVKRSCGAGCKELSVAADGTVYPCHMLHRAEWALGNVFEEPLADLLQGERARTLATLDAAAIEDCRDCRHRQLCGGGCRARSLYAFGDLAHKDGYCAMMEEYYDRLGAGLASQFA